MDKIITDTEEMICPACNKPLTATEIAPGRFQFNSCACRPAKEHLIPPGAILNESRRPLGGPVVPSKPQLDFILVPRKSPAFCTRTSAQVRRLRPGSPMLQSSRTLNLGALQNCVVLQ
jgi:ssDNA-binding Zn-finger/Zn-ribbon topoisomerase 1